MKFNRKDLDNFVYSHKDEVRMLIPYVMINVGQQIYGELNGKIEMSINCLWSIVTKCKKPLAKRERDTLTKLFNTYLNKTITYDEDVIFEKQQDTSNFILISLDDITKIYAKKKPFSFSDQHLKRYYAFLDFNTTLDLHGKNVNDSLEILEEWLEYGRKLGHKHFKIIHGKGEGILRECVKRFLKRKKILEFSHESDFGGSTTLEL